MKKYVIGLYNSKFETKDNLNNINCNIIFDSLEKALEHVRPSDHIVINSSFTLLEYDIKYIMSIQETNNILFFTSNNYNTDRSNSIIKLEFSTLLACNDFINSNKDTLLYILKIINVNKE